MNKKKNMDINYNIPIILFALMELANVFFLYFNHQSKLGNGIGVFSHILNNVTYLEEYLLIEYLIYWVAGVKLMFIALLLIIGVFGSREIQRLTYLAIAITSLSYFCKLRPIIGLMDNLDIVEPKGYSKTLNIMICLIIIIFTILFVMKL